MATISHIPFSLSFPSFEFRKPLFYYHHHHQQPPHFVSYLNSTKKHGFICFACSIKQTRVRKKVKSNEELRSEIMEFVSFAGLPQGHVPSMKELSAHGRVDLANIVRRRGYKFVKELLANSDLEDCNELVSEKSTNMDSSASGVSLEHSLTEGQGEGVRDVVDENLSTEQPSGSELYFTAPDGSMPLDQERNDYLKEDAITNPSPEAEVHGSVNKDELSLTGILSSENSFSNLGDSNQSGEITENTLKIERVELNNRPDVDNTSSEATISASHSLVLDGTSSCPDTEADDVLMTENEEVDDLDKDFSLTYDHYTSPTNDHYTSPTNDHYTSPTNDHYTSPTYNHYTSPDLSYTKRVDIATESLSADMAENRSGSGDDSLVESESNGWMSGLSSSTSSIEERTTRFLQSGYLDTVDDEITHESDPEEAKESVETTKSDKYIGDSYGGQKSLSTPSNGSALTLEEVTHVTEVNSFDSNSGQRDGSDDLDTDPHDETRKQENQVEITRLRSMLHQKELELSRLKEQIEKEKLSLLVLQRQAETEIHEAQMLILEKDAELQEVEENLSGLQEVVIEFCGDGNVVEVTGSFNGWQHRVGMELQASKSIGEQKFWSTLLWLYPGTYEIKFIVDSQWITDPQRDSVTKGHITNNILKVVR